MHMCLALRQVLRSKMLRRSAGRQAYHDKSLATEEAMLTGRLHTWMPGGDLNQVCSV